MARPSRAALAAAQAAAEAVAESESQRDEAIRLSNQDDIPADPEKIERDEEDLLAALRELDTGSDIEWSVHKISGSPDERGFIEKLASQQLSLQYFRDKYGPGEYKVLGRRGGYYVKGGYKQVKISTVGWDPSTPHASEGNSVKEVLAAMEAQRAARKEELKSWAALLVPVLGPVVLDFFKPKNQVKELLEGLAALKGLTPEPKEPESVTKQLDNLAGVMARVKEMSGGDDKPVVGSTWIDLIREAVSGLRPVLEGVIAARAGAMPAPGAIPMARPIQLQAPPTASVATPAADGSTTAAPASNGGDNPMLLLIPWLRATLESLLIQAARDRDPGIYAEVTVDNLPLGTDPKVFREFIERPDWWEMLQKFDPRVSHYVGWFNAFRREVLVILKEGEEAPAPAPGPDLSHGQGGEEI